MSALNLLSNAQPLASGFIESYISNLNLPFLFSHYFGQELWKFLVLAIIVITGPIIRALFTYIIVFFEKVTNNTKTELDNILLNSVNRELGWIALAIYWYVALLNLQFSEGFTKGAITVLKIVAFFHILKAIYNISTHSETILKSLSRRLRLSFDKSIYPLVSRIIKTVILVFGPLVALQNLGVNVISLLAGLGLGGLAFALAAKDTAANLFGSFMIILDKPFKSGDWIIVGDSEGTVTEIGLRSTRLRTFYDSVISIPNADMANKKIDNMGKRSFRRVKTTLGITYDTSPEKIEGFLEAIKKIIEAHPNTRKDYYQVVFTGFGASSLDILLYFFVQAEDWSRELVIKQNVFLDIIRAAKDLEVEFAFPTNTLHIDSYTEQKPKAPEKSLEEIKSISASYKEKANPRGKGVYKPIYETE